MADNRERTMQKNQVISAMEQGLDAAKEGTNYSELLEVIGRFPGYSLENHVLILKERPQARFLATYDDFKELHGRQVVRGAKSFGILTQTPVKTAYEIEAVDPVTGKLLLNEDGQPEMKRVEIEEMDRHVMRVFDVSQTTGKTVVGNYFEAETLRSAMESFGHLKFRYQNLDGEISSYDSEQREIVIQQGMDVKDTVRELLYRVVCDAAGQKNIQTDQSSSFFKDTKLSDYDMVADSVAYALTTRYRLDASKYKFAHVSEWLGGKSRAEFRETMYQIKNLVRDLARTIDERASSLENEHHQNPDLMIRITDWTDESSYKIVKGIYREDFKQTLKDFEQLVNRDLAKNIGDYFDENNIQYEDIPYKDTGDEQLNVRNCDFEYIKNEYTVIDIQEVLNQRLDIAETDVVLELSGGMGTDVGYAIITNKDKAQVQALMEKYMEMVEEGEAVSEYEFLESEGVESTYIEVIADDEIGHMDRYYGNTYQQYTYEDDQFFDLSYDADGNDITYPTELEIVRQAKYIMQRLEYKEILFSRAEVDAVMLYAQKCDDIDKVKDIINRIADDKPATQFGINKKWLDEMGIDLSQEVIVKFSYGLTDHESVYKRITNKDRRDVGELLKRVVEEVAGELEGEIASFLTGQGVAVETILDADGNIDKNIRTYDFHCDLDFDEVTDMHHIFEERKPVAETDVVVKFMAGEGISVNYQRITNLNREEVKTLLDRLAVIRPAGYEGKETDFLEQQGARTDDLLEKWTSDIVDGELFFDFEYDMDLNKVIVSQSLLIREQAEQRMNRMEHTELHFSEGERADLIAYAEKTQDMDKTTELAKLVAAGKPGEIRIQEFGEVSSEILKEAAKEPVKEVGISSEETSLLYGHDDYFGIYQLRRETATDEYRFENIDYLQTNGLQVKKEHYDLMYQGKLGNETLDDIFERFNINRPADFKGHSLSVSDIVVIRREGETKAHYVDSFGFEEIEDFYQQLEKDVILSVRESDTETGGAKQYISFYAAEDGEFHVRGEYHDNLTLQEAIAHYQAIPAERMNAGKAIGFELQTGLDGVFADASMELFYGNRIDMDYAEHAEYIRGNPLIWDAMKELAKTFPDAEILNQETIRRLAEDINHFVKEYDPYEYRDTVDNPSDMVEEIVRAIQANEMEDVIEWLQKVVNDEGEVLKENVQPAADLLDRIDDIYLRRERNPLTKVEELEESNYNQIDGMLNNLDTGRESLKGSIHNRLEQAKETLAREQGQPPAKEAAKRREERES